MLYKNHARMIAVAPDGVRRIAFGPFVEIKMVVGFLPTVQQSKNFVHHEKAHTVAQIEKPARRDCAPSGWRSPQFPKIVQPPQTPRTAAPNALPIVMQTNAFEQHLLPFSMKPSVAVKRAVRMPN